MPAGMAALIGRRPRLVMFDLDGTLVDSASDIARALNLTLADAGLPVATEAQVRDWIGRGAARLIACARAHFGVLETQQEALLASFLAHYEANVSGHTTPLPGAEALLTACAQAGLHLACVTNKPFAHTTALLRDLGWGERFHLVLGGDSLPQRKPDPAALRHCLERFSVSANEALMVGDSRNDVEAAQAAGVPVIALRGGYNHGEPIEACAPDWIVDSLAVLA